jgi:hypothetical protein
MGVLAELCQRGLIEAVSFNAFFKDNTELVNHFRPIISGRLPTVRFLRSKQGMRDNFYHIFLPLSPLHKFVG